MHNQQSPPRRSRACLERCWISRIHRKLNLDHGSLWPRAIGHTAWNAALLVPCIALVVLATPGFAQCDTCQGRCQYGVEGSCRPKVITYGYYQSTWRKWPVPPPPVPKFTRSDATGDSDTPEIELPDAFDEADLNPEFPYRKKKASDAASDSPVIPIDEFPADAAIDAQLPGPTLPGPLDDSSTRHLPTIRGGFPSQAVRADYNRGRERPPTLSSPPMNPLRPGQRAVSRASYSTGSGHSWGHIQPPRTMSASATNPANVSRPKYDWNRHGSLRRETPQVPNPLRR